MQTIALKTREQKKGGGWDGRKLRGRWGRADNIHTKTLLKCTYVHTITCMYTPTLLYLLLGTADHEQTTSEPRRQKAPAAGQHSNSSSNAGECMCCSVCQPIV